MPGDDETRAPRRRGADGLPEAARTLGLVWLALLAQPWLARGTGEAAATTLCFAFATAVVVLPMLPLPPDRKAAALLLVGLVAGATLRDGLGLLLPPAGGGAVGLARAAQVALAPVFEELLYRERLLVPLRQRLGAAGAVAITSALFAVPHVEPALVVQTFAMGLALGVVRLASGSVALCVGIHAGWNAAAC
jgi:membrane protease YdiL (CAAX protease family)